MVAVFGSATMMFVIIRQGLVHLLRRLVCCLTHGPALQVVGLEFTCGATATLTTTAFTRAVCQRHTRIFGTEGELEGDGEAHIVVRLFGSGVSGLGQYSPANSFYFLYYVCQETRVFNASGPPSHTKLVGHNGADYYLIHSFIKVIRGCTATPNVLLSTAILAPVCSRTPMYASYPCL